MAPNAHLYRRDNYWPLLFLFYGGPTRAVRAEKWLFSNVILGCYRKPTVLAEQTPECCFGGC